LPESDIEAKEAGWEAETIKVSPPCADVRTSLPSLVKSKVALLGAGASSLLAAHTAVFSEIPDRKTPIE
jgi:hypothetical protein